MEASKFKEAKIFALKKLESNKDDWELLFNGGLAAYLSEDYKTAIELWERLKVLDPNNLKIHAKLIQAYEITKEFEKRDKEIAIIYKVYEKQKGEKPDEDRFYIRDQFKVGDKLVMVIEYFFLEGDRAKKFNFRVFDKEGQDDNSISLGSYNSTNDYMQVEQKLLKGERYYHLDGYFKDNSHKTYEFFKGVPKYNDLKKTVIEIIEGKKKAISETKTDKSK